MVIFWQSADPETGKVYEDVDKSRFEIALSKALDQESIDQMTYPNRTNAAQASNNNQFIGRDNFSLHAVNPRSTNTNTQLVDNDT